MRKTVLALLIILSMLFAGLNVTALAASGSNNYSDISGQWFSDAVTKYGYADVFADGSGKFHPGMKITRIEFVRLLHRALGISINYFTAPDISDDFTDMQNTDTGANELIDLVTAGIVNRGGAFDPDKQLNRETMIHWLIKALDYMTGGDYKIPKIKPISFKDGGHVAAAYRSDVDTATMLQLIKGRDNGLLFPKDGATRAEAATVVMRLVALLETLCPEEPVVVTASATETDGGLVMRLEILNSSDKTVTITHSSSQRFDFQLLDAAGETLYTWSADKQFLMVISTTEIEPGRSVDFTDTLSPDAWDAVKDTVVSFKAYITGTSEDFSIKENGYDAAITA